MQLLRVAVTWFYCTSGTICRLAGTAVSISGKTDFRNAFIRNSPPAIYWFYCDVTWCCREGLCSWLRVEADVVRFIARAVGRRLLKGEAMMQPHGSPGGIFWDKVALGRILSGQFGLPITVKRHLYGLIGKASYPDMQKIRIIGFFFENRLHWQFGCWHLHYVPVSKFSTTPDLKFWKP